MKNKAKLGVFFAFSLIIPIIYLSLRFQLFNKKIEKQLTSKLSIGLLIVILIFACVVGVFIKYYIDGMKTKYSFFKQILQGILKVILPMVVVLVIFLFLKNEVKNILDNIGKVQNILDNINKIIEAIIVLIGCESVAIIFNPLPKWAFDNNVDGLVEISDKIFHKGEENK